MTRLEAYLKEWGVKPTALARNAGISRKHLFQLRKGIAEPTRATMCKLALAASTMRNRRVFIIEMFTLTESEDLTHQLLIVAKVILATMPGDPRVQS